MADIFNIEMNEYEQKRSYSTYSKRLDYEKLSSK